LIVIYELKVANGNFWNPVNNIGGIEFYSGGAGGVDYHFYVDAVGFSWDPNYNIRDNLYEGLLLSYKSSISLDWIGYSLDGQWNRTILGNTTISMPNDGLHSVQVFGNDSIGNIYESEVRYFTVSSISSISPFNPFYLIVIVLSILGLAGVATIFYILYTKRQRRVKEIATEKKEIQKEDVKPKAAKITQQLWLICSFCGVKLPVDMNYCTNCGKRIKF